LDPGIAFLAKPFTPSALVNRVRKVLDMPNLASQGASPERDDPESLGKPQAAVNPKGSDS
jgi:hypothetical protein